MVRENEFGFTQGWIIISGKGFFNLSKVRIGFSG
jgi:hypothetical protein